MHEIVKHHNDLNTIPMRSWTAEEMNFFFTIIAKVKNKGTKHLTFETNELKELSQFTGKSNQRWSEIMIRVSNKVADLKYSYEDEDTYEVMNLFTYFKVNKNEKTVEVEVSSRFEYILNQLEINFTYYKLDEFVRIQSAYAKTMYRLLKQWKTVGKKEYKISELKQILDTPDYYTPSHIDRLVIKPINKELSTFFENLKVKKVKANTQGNPVKSYIFTWNPEKTGVYDSNKYKKKQRRKITRKETLPDWFGKETPENDYIDPEVEKDFNEKLRKLREDKT